MDNRGFLETHVWICYGFPDQGTDEGRRDRHQEAREGVRERGHVGSSPLSLFSPRRAGDKS